MTNFRKVIRVSQETFDDTVRENIEEFEMEVNEAIADAIEQFKKQGVNLSNIDQSVAHAKGEQPPMLKALQNLKDTKDSITPESDTTSYLESLRVLRTSLVDESQDYQTLAGCNGGVELMIELIQCTNANISAQSMDAFRALLRNHKTNQEFVRQSGLAALASVMQDAMNKKDISVIENLLLCVRSTAVRNEQNKVGWRRAGGCALLLKTLDELATVERCGLIKEVCLTIRCIISRDDPSVEIASAAEAIKEIVDGGVMGIVLPKLEALNDLSGVTATADQKEGALALAQKAAQLKISNELPPAPAPNNDDFVQDAVCGLCSVLKGIITTDETCKQFIKQHDGLNLVVTSLQKYGMMNDKCAKWGLAAMRNISGNDKFKKQVSSHLPLFCTLMQKYTQYPGTLEQGYAVLATLALRQPELQQQMIELDAHMMALQHLEIHKAVQGPANGAFLRQAILALRNIVSRSPDVHDSVLSTGAEELLRALHANAQCDDEAYLALQALQCELKSLNRRNTRKEAYAKADNFRETWDESEGISEAIDATPMPDLTSYKVC